MADTLAQAIEGCGFIAATTSRHRDQNFRIIDAREAAPRLIHEASHSSVALLFGAERTGLTNEDLEVAHLLIRIRAHESYLSLNLAMAVQIMAYELLCARGAAECLVWSVSCAYFFFASFSEIFSSEYFTPLPL